MGFGRWVRGGGPSKVASVQRDYKERLQYFSNKMDVNPAVIPFILSGDYSGHEVDTLCTWVTTPFEGCLEREFDEPQGNLPPLFEDMLSLYQGGQYSGEEFFEWAEEWEQFLEEYEIDVWHPPSL